MKFKDNYEALSPEDPQDSSVFLEGVLKRHNIDMSSPERQILLQWENIAGKALAQGSVCTDLKNGTLFVTCENSAKASLIRLNKAEIIKNITAVFPEVKVSKINIRLK